MRRPQNLNLSSIWFDVCYSKCQIKWKITPNFCGLLRKAELYAANIIYLSLKLIFNNFSRADLFIQAKLWNSNHRAEHVEPDLDATLKDLGTTYVDSFVIHWPQACPSTGLAPTLRINPRCPGISQNYPAHFSKGDF